MILDYLDGPSVTKSVLIGSRGRSEVEKRLVTDGSRSRDNVDGTTNQVM